MKKVFLLLIIAVTLLTGCKKDKAVIFFSPHPFRPDTFATGQTAKVFSTGQRIYFLIWTPEPFTSDVLKLQLLKINEELGPLSYSLAQGRDFEVSANKEYATNYFCLYKEGYYVLRIFSKDKLDTPLAEADFRVVSQ